MGILDLKIILHLSVIIKVSFTKAQQDKNCLSKRLTGCFNQKTSNLKSQWLPLGGSNGLLAKASASVVGAADTRSFEHRPGHRTPKYPLGNGSDCPGQAAAVQSPTQIQLCFRSGNMVRGANFMKQNKQFIFVLVFELAETAARLVSLRSVAKCLWLWDCHYVLSNLYFSWLISLDLWIKINMISSTECITGHSPQSNQSLFSTGCCNKQENQNIPVGSSVNLCRILSNMNASRF